MVAGIVQSPLQSLGVGGIFHRDPNVPDSSASPGDESSIVLTTEGFVIRRAHYNTTAPSFACFTMRIGSVVYLNR